MQPIESKSISTLYIITGALFLGGIALLCTGEPTLKPNIYHKYGINLLYVAFLSTCILCFVKKIHLTFLALDSKYALFMLCGIIAFGFVSLYFSADRGLSLLYMRRFLLEPFIFMCAAAMYFYALDSKARAIFLYLLAILIMLQPILTIIDFVLYADSKAVNAKHTSLWDFIGVYRAMPKFFSEAQTGYAFFLILSFSVSLAIFAQYRLVGVILLIINIAACVCLSTRFLYVAYAAMCVAAACLAHYKYKRVILPCVLCGTIALACGFYFFSAHLSDRFNIYGKLHVLLKVWELSPAEMGKFDPNCIVWNTPYGERRCMPQSFPKDSHIVWEHSSLNRIAMSKSTYLGIMDNPLRPNGYGLVLFAKNIVRIFGQDSKNLPYYISIFEDGSILPFYWTNHNGFLYAWFELGLVGFMLMGWLFAWILLRGYKIYFAATRPRGVDSVRYIESRRIFVLGFTIFSIGLIVGNFFDALPNRAGQNLGFMLLGMFLAINTSARRKK